MRPLAIGPTLLTFTPPDGKTQQQSASTLWTEDGTRAVYLTPSWRHALDLGPRVSDSPLVYEVDDDRWPPGTTVTIDTDNVPVWWSTRDQPDRDLRDLLTER
jgi:hypothetical protein